MRTCLHARACKGRGRYDDDELMIMMMINDDDDDVDDDVDEWFCVCACVRRRSHAAFLGASPSGQIRREPHARKVCFKLSPETAAKLRQANHDWPGHIEATA
jgi:hypothetical protein